MDEKYTPLNAADAFAEAEKLWKAGQREKIQRLYDEEYAPDRTLLVLADDPTGCQTVHGIHVVTDWEQETLDEGFRSGESMFFVLTNSRSFSAEKTESVHKEIALRAVSASKKAGKPYLFISRGDSTLRGHFPLETQVLRETLEANGHPAFDGEILCPFFEEGGRFTLNSVHYVLEGCKLVPAAQTEFAKDATFGYWHSYLPEYIEEKTGGAVRASHVIRVSLREIRGTEPEDIEQKLWNAQGFHYIVWDAVEETDVQMLAVVLHRLLAKGRHYMCRTAAAVPKVLGHVSSRPLLAPYEIADGKTDTGGLVLIGSHVEKTNRQLEALRQSRVPMEWIEFDAGRYRSGLDKETKRCAALAEEAMQNGKTAVVYTSRRLIAPPDTTAEERLAISVRISDALTAVISSLSLRPRFLIAKGGITSSDVAVKALRVRRALVLGQAAPGVPVWKTGPESLFPGLAYIIFPGNVGDDLTLRRIVEACQGAAE